MAATHAAVALTARSASHHRACASLLHTHHPRTHQHALAAAAAPQRPLCPPPSAQPQRHNNSSTTSTSSSSSSSSTSSSNPPQQQQQRAAPPARVTRRTQTTQAFDLGGVSSPLTPPLSALDVDHDLWGLLDLCSDGELVAVHNVLFGPSPFSPMVKSLAGDSEPAALERRGRSSVMHRIEARFRFLAADSATTLKGSRPSYRDALLSVRER